MKSYRLLGLAFASAIASFTVLADAPTPAAESATSAAPAPGTPAVSLEDIQTFAAVYRAVKDAYVEPVDDKVLMRAAIRGLLSGLDPHSEYLDIRGLTALDEETTGEYGGVGLEVLFLDGSLRVIAPIDDTPAARAGIKSGDVIVRIDGESVVSDDGERAIDRLRGKPGSEIALTVAREGSDLPLELTLRREVIRTASVRVRQVEPGYVYVRISQFQSETGGELRRKLRQSVAQADGRVRGVVLDLRSNPGGLLHAAVEVSDAFLDEGLIVSTRGRLDDADTSFNASKGDLVSGAPLVILVDGGTASAAEIVAGALKDLHRGLVMGSRTFGKGSVQTVLPLNTGDAVKLTTARYFTPNGTSIQASGIRPDIVLADLRLTPPDRPATLLGIGSERELRGHLAGEAESDVVDSGPEARDPEIDSDYALNEALNVLKGLALARERQGASPPKG
jgi:carboxyl-terminal processing protease